MQQGRDCRPNRRAQFHQMDPRSHFISDPDFIYVCNVFLKLSRRIDFLIAF